MRREDEEDLDNNSICRFCEKELLSDKVRDHCHLTGKNRGPAHNTCNINVKPIVILYHLHFIILVITIVICSSRVWLI